MQEIIVRSPGRINLLGEHTDYNDGWVLPAAINQYVQVNVTKRTDDRIVLVAYQYQEQLEIALEAVQPLDHPWANYVLGVVDQLLKKGLSLSGFRMTIDGEVPVGAGMSSSAAVECAVIFALNELFGLGLSKLSMVLLAQAAEHHFPGVQCGIMDPYASIFGKKGMALQLDCAMHTHRYVPLPLEGYKIVLFNTNVKHSLATSAYNQRRVECEAVVKKVQAREKNVRSLRDVTLPLLYQYVADPTLRKRARYVIRENARLLAGCEDLKIGDLESFGKKMSATHQGLREDYEVSCPELDWLVDAVAGEKNVLGARMMGGGFGGCTINIIKDEAIEAVCEQLATTYEKAMGKKLSVYIAETADGTSLVTKNNYADA
jgi:galactokinase